MTRAREEQAFRVLRSIVELTNKLERHRHQDAAPTVSGQRKVIFFHRLGQIRDRAYENQFPRARGLNLRVAAVILWNTAILGRRH